MNREGLNCALYLVSSHGEVTLLETSRYAFEREAVERSGQDLSAGETVMCVNLNGGSISWQARVHAVTKLVLL